jgi:hypothetical protein
MRKFTPILVVAALTMASLSAHAVVKYSATTTRSSWWSTLNESFAVPLNDLGDTQVKFNLPAAKKVLLTFTIVCAVSGSSTTNDPRVHLDIIVNNSTVDPTRGETDALCSGNHTGIPDAFSTHTIAAAISGKKGVNTVSIVGGRKGAAVAVWFTNSSLIISD